MGPEQPTLEAILMALRVEFLLRHGANTERAVLLAEVSPHAAQRAATLFGAGGSSACADGERRPQRWCGG